MRDITPKERYLKILEFRHFVEFFSFNKIGENHRDSEKRKSSELLMINLDEMSLFDEFIKNTIIERDI